MTWTTTTSRGSSTFAASSENRPRQAVMLETRIFVEIARWPVRRR
jgi:hypothetical protein